jgi:threonine/homoserine/homoserine lactone efflux protein
MAIEQLLSFLGAAILLTVMPGPDNIFVLTESVTKGHRNGVAVSIGLCCGVLIHTLAAATGVSLIIQKSVMAFSVIKYLGAGYLFYLAYRAYKEKQTAIVLSRKVIEKKSFVQLIRKGLLMNVLNPKVSLFFYCIITSICKK